MKYFSPVNIHHSRIFVVPKTSGGWRPVLDLSALNLYLHWIHFRMEMTSSIRDAIQQEDWGYLPQHDGSLLPTISEIPRAGSLHRRVKFWLGRPCRHSECLGEMASSPVKLAHQQTRGRGCGSLPQGVPPHLRGKAVRFFTDNTTVAFYVNKQGGWERRVRYLSVRVDEILLWCQSNDILLLARHTRQIEHRSGCTQSVPHGASNRVDPLPRSPTADLAGFASPNGRSLLHQVHPPPGDIRLPGPRPRGMGIGHFCRCPGFHSWAKPSPHPSPRESLQKASVDQASIILVASKWPAQPWFPDLLSLTHVPPYSCS